MRKNSQVSLRSKRDFSQKSSKTETYLESESGYQYQRARRNYEEEDDFIQTSEQNVNTNESLEFNSDIDVQ